MGKRDTIVGEVRKIDKRKEKTFQWFTEGELIGRGESDVYAFVVERFDEEGNVLPPVAVQMSSKGGFAGVLSEGDQVIFFADGQPGNEVVKPDALRNLTAGALFGDRKKVKRGDVPTP